MADLALDIQALRDTSKLPADKRDFAQSLVRSFDRYGSVSEKQGFWVAKLARMARGEAEPEPAKVAELGALVELFDRASAKLKFPKITFDESEAGVPLVLNRAGSNARQPGSVNLTDGGPYGANRWYGRIERSGTFVAGSVCPSSLLAFLGRLATGTADIAAMYGRRTGKCCFCNRDLSDARSVEVGYGPVCADHYGLPWGETTTKRTKRVKLAVVEAEAA